MNEAFFKCITTRVAKKITRSWRKAHSLRAQAGFYLPFLAIAFVALIALVGLAIDGGRAFLTQLRLQRSVDAGVIAAMGGLNRRPGEFIRDVADRFTRENMVRARLVQERDDADVTVALETVTTPQGLTIHQRLNVLGRVDSPTTFLRVIPGLPRTVPLEASATAGTPPIAVILVLDRSGSMEGEKLTALKASAIAFIQQLSVGDWFGVVSYAAGNTGNMRVQSTISLVQFNPALLASYTAAINGLVADGGTCIACGMLRARQWFAAPPLGFPEGARRFMVVMTDGAPEHSGCNSWMDGQPGMTQGTNCGHTGYGAGQWNQHTGTPAGHWNGVAWQGDYNGGTQDIYRTIWQSDQARREGITLYTIGLGEDGSLYCHRPGPFAPVNNHLAPQRPWQPKGCYNGSNQGADSTSLRPYLLRRLANDMNLELPCDLNTSGGCMSPAAPPFLPMPEYQDPNSHPHCVPAVGSSYPRGLYVETPEPSLLSDLFLRIFLEIKKARLVE